MYSLQGAGHCYTFNPENESLSGVKGQMNLYLGRNSFIFSCESNSIPSRTVSESVSLSVLMFPIKALKPGKSFAAEGYSNLVDIQFHLSVLR